MIKTLTAALLAGTALLPATAWAQTTTAPATPAQVSDTTAAQGTQAADDTAAAPAKDGDVIVTARYRNESVREVPIAITAITGSSLDDRQLTNLQTIATAVPSVEFRAGASNKDRTVFIRGVGTITTSPGVEPSVSTVLDGVVLSRPGQSTLDLGEVERIEVLRGPQGTLFGKNASAGVINIVTRNPTDEFQAFGEASATTDDEYRFKAGAVGRDRAGQGAGADRRPVHALERQCPQHGDRRQGQRVRALWRPRQAVVRSDARPALHGHRRLSAFARHGADRHLRVDDADRLSQRCHHQQRDAGGAARGVGVTASRDNRNAAANFDTDVRDENFGGSVTGELRLGDYNVTSITAYRKWLNHQHQDFDTIATLAVGFPQGEDLGDVNSRQISQELRLTSPKGGFIDYVVGGYYLRGLTDERYMRTITTLAAVGATPITSSGVANYGIRSNNYSVFGEANINFTRAFRAIAGYRSIWDDVNFYHVRTSTFDPTNQGAINPALDRPGIRSYHNATGSVSRRGDAYRLGLQLDLGRNNQTYFTYSRGYKGPGYNVYFNMRSLNQTNSLAGPVVPLDEVPLSPETSNSYEAGIKGSTADRSFSYALAAYTTDFQGYQANFADTVGGLQVTRLINAGSVRSRGAELDVTLRPTRGFSVDLSGAYTDAIVRHFNCPVGAAASCNIDGQPLPFAPKVKLYESAQYRFALTDALKMELQTNVTYRSRTQYSLSETPSTIEPAYAIWDASVAFLTSDSGLQLRGFVKNITNTHYSSFLGNGSAAGTVRFVPRDDVRYGGVQLRKDF